MRRRAVDDGFMEHSLDFCRLHEEEIGAQDEVRKMSFLLLHSMDL